MTDQGGRLGRVGMCVSRTEWKEATVEIEKRVKSGIYRVDSCSP
jgi:hypothetical protein